MATRTSDGTFSPSPVRRSSDPDERTGDQNRGSNGEGVLIAPGLRYANGGSLDNPMGFPGYDQLYVGNPTVYRWMLQLPVLQLVRAIATAPILASGWEYVSTDDALIRKEWLAQTGTTFDNIRTDLVNDFYIDGRDMGWACGEPIWEYNNGIYDLPRVKPLLQDVTDVMRDKFGNFIGLRNYVPVDPDKGGLGYTDLSAPYKAFKYTYPRRHINPYGRSWLENCRATAWKDWLDCAQQLQKLGAKISGIVTIITSPAGTFPGPPGPDGKPTAISYAKNAQAAIEALAKGAAGIWFPSLGLMPDAKGNIDAMKVLVELAGKSLTNIDVKDFGSNSQAITPILERQKHAEELMFNAGLRSARVGLQSQHGTTEEAGVHTDTGTVVAETEDEGFALQCQPLVDAYVSLNFTPRAAGKIRIKAPSLVDRKTAVLKAVLLSLLNEPHIAQGLAQAPGAMDNILKTLDVKVDGPFNVEELKKAIEASNKKSDPAAKKDNPEPQGGRPATK